MRYLYLILIVFLACSCKDPQKDKIARLVREWEGKEIVFPTHSIFTIQGKDTVDFSFLDAEYKVVTYIDSIGCASCKLQLPRWNAFIREVDSLKNSEVPFLFYFHPKDKKELKYITRRDNFDFPVCFDEMDELNHLNQFPSETTFQTFLLNKKNKVIAIGNPIHNPKVKELYLQILTGDKKSATVPLTEVSLEQTTITFGTFPWNEKQERKFELVNEGQSPLIIYDVIASCGCTKVSYNKEPIRSGDKLELSVVYEADKPEHFSKTIKVYCNVTNSPLRLTVVGDAK